MSSPDRDYSLTRARANFEAHGCMDDREEAKSRREDASALLAARKELEAAFDGLKGSSDPQWVAAQWKLIREREGSAFRARHGQAR